MEHGSISDKCIYEKEIGRLLNIINVESTGIINHLKNNPVYACYFCDGFNYNCVDYEVSRHTE